MDDEILKAIEIAVKAHGFTSRKYYTAPYMVHPVRVMRKVNDYLRNWPGGKRFEAMAKEMLIVAALHDVPEDTTVTIEDLRKDFGDVVAEGLTWMTNPSHLPENKRLKRALRKEIDRRHWDKAPDHWKIVKMWDRVDNMYDLVVGEVPFILDVYLPESRLLLEVLSHADPMVGEQLNSAIGWLEAITKGARKAG
jgi:(p)ppGpp synthase/HD superfamily hydrolase